ncbi:MAG: hypothetical protein M9939_00925 [Mesorhizobium sp.]|nr:hypothetical protein [Mesorhizobium sp.]MCO5159671.1 hypothetical protein [Mesorhizobium sp.]
MSKHYYTVTIPIAGHAVVEVEADSEEQAKELALDQVELKHIETWDALHTVSSGNVLHFPSPWGIEVHDEGEVDE